MRALALAFALTCGCLSLHPPPPRSPGVAVKPLVTVTPAVSTAPAAIRVLRGRGDLPRGLFYYADRATPRYTLYAVPGYPTADRAHVVIAAMAPAGPVPYGAAPLLERDYRERASALGADALFDPEDGSDLVFAIALGHGEPPLDGEPADALIRSRQRELRGYQPVGPPIAVALTDAAWDLATQDAHCYAAIFAFEPGAALSDAAQAALYLELESDDGLLGNRSYGSPTEPIANPEHLPIAAPRDGRFVGLRSHAAELGCAQGRARARIRLWTTGKITAIGLGAMKVVLYQRAISQAELAAKVKEHQEAWAAAQVEAERQRQDDEARAREREQRRRDDAARAAQLAMRDQPDGGGRAGAAAFFSMSLKNDCPRTVRLFIGDQPRFGSGTSTSVSANSITSYSGTAPQRYWIVDDDDQGLSAYTAQPGRNAVRILPTCTGFAAD